MKKFTTLCLIISGILMSGLTMAQSSWPMSARLSNGNEIKMYQWEPLNLNGSKLEAKAAIAVQEEGKSDLRFGIAWIDAQVDRKSRQTVVNSARITGIKVPGIDDESTLNDIQGALENGLNSWPVSFANDEMDQQLKLHEEQSKLATQLDTKAPSVIYRDKPALLVYIDGEPRLQQNKDWGMEAVINTPFSIVKYNYGAYYLYGGGNWYKAPSATGPYTYIKRRPSGLKKVEDAVKSTDEQKEKNANESEYARNTKDIIPEIVVSTSPAELIQSNGEANFTPVQGTSLLYVRNSPNDIFLDVNSQQYYVLLAGRWYKSGSLKGNWVYTASDQLPAEFAKIPEGSPKDNVLASIAGTPAAEEAVMDAQVPQTARVDRRNTNADVQYDGNPRFESIDGLDLDYAVNTSSPVIRWRGRYYLVDNGVWFESYNATGPWVVAVERPYVVSLIPPRYPVYNMKYVYIYDVYPDYVYMGYTPGYLNTYVYGPTVVYGTGYYYNPWYNNYYFARPCTWGFGMQYNPWYGWSFGLNIGWGWFYHPHYYYGRPYYWGGWWGPYRYRPAYCWSGYNYGGYHYGYYGRYGVRNVTVVNNYYNNYNSTNIYNNRNGVYSPRTRNDVYYNGGRVRERGGVAANNRSNVVRYERDRAANFNNVRNSAFNRGDVNNGRPERTMTGRNSLDGSANVRERSNLPSSGTNRNSPWQNGSNVRERNGTSDGRNPVYRNNEAVRERGNSPFGRSEGSSNSPAPERRQAPAPSQRPVYQPPQRSERQERPAAIPRQAPSAPRYERPAPSAQPRSEPSRSSSPSAPSRSGRRGG